MEALQRSFWPGNIRELENVIERAVILSPGPDLRIAPEVLPVPTAPAESPDAAPPGLAGLAEVERQHIVTILKQTGWRIDGPGTGAAARLLDLNPSTLRSRMQKTIRREDQRANHADTAAGSSPFAVSLAIASPNAADHLLQ